jgi:uncharacterized membrane protein YdfJ with MMPL/SSD domain
MAGKVMTRHDTTDSLDHVDSVDTGRPKLRNASMSMKATTRTMPRGPTFSTCRAWRRCCPLAVPPQVLTGDDFTKAATVFVSPDGHAVRYLIQAKLDPFSTAAMDQVDAITDTARSAQPNTALLDASMSMAGFPAANSIHRAGRGGRGLQHAADLRDP